MGWVKSGEFRQLTRCVSKTIKDRRIVSNKVEQEVVFALSNGGGDDQCQPVLLQWVTGNVGNENLYLTRLSISGSKIKRKIIN